MASILFPSEGGASLEGNMQASAVKAECNTRRIQLPPSPPRAELLFRRGERRHGPIAWPAIAAECAADL